jgi:hypothetical protein
LSHAQAEETKQRRKEEKKAAREGLLVERAENDVSLDDGPSGTGSPSEGQNKHEAPLLLNPDLPNLKAVVEKADVVLLVLDARDPVSYRLPHIEELVSANEKAKLVFLINKIGALLAVSPRFSHASHTRPRTTGSIGRMGKAFTYTTCHFSVPFCNVVPSQATIK